MASVSEQHQIGAKDRLRLATNGTDAKLSG